MQHTSNLANSVAGHEDRCSIVAEAGVNHNGQMELAHRLLDEASRCEVDAIKFQAFAAEEIVTGAVHKAPYQLAATGSAEGQLAMLKRLQLSADQHRELKDHCDRNRLTYLCTPYDHASADLLLELGVDSVKIASTDVTNLPFLRHVARMNRPIMLSTGMSSLGEVEAAVCAIEAMGNRMLCLLHCTAEYPAPISEINLSAIETLRVAFG